MQVKNNAEISALKQIIGLQHNKNYADAKSLRYGKVMIMTDQDQDGSHIKGLVMNFLHHFYPSLLQVPGFLVEFITPIVKVCPALAFCSLSLTCVARRWLGVRVIPQTMCCNACPESRSCTSWRCT